MTWDRKHFEITTNGNRKIGSVKQDIAQIIGKDAAYILLCCNGEELDNNKKINEIMNGSQIEIQQNGNAAFYGSHPLLDHDNENKKQKKNRNKNKNKISSIIESKIIKTSQIEGHGIGILIHLTTGIISKNDIIIACSAQGAVVTAIQELSLTSNNRNNNNNHNINNKYVDNVHGPSMVYVITRDFVSDNTIVPGGKMCIVRNFQNKKENRNLNKEISRLQNYVQKEVNELQKYTKKVNQLQQSNFIHSPNLDLLNKLFTSFKSGNVPISGFGIGNIDTDQVDTDMKLARAHGKCCFIFGLGVKVSHDAQSLADKNNVIILKAKSMSQLANKLSQCNAWINNQLMNC